MLTMPTEQTRFLPERAAVLKKLLKLGLLYDENSAIILHDLDHLKRRFSELQASFPATAIHAFAIKANPLLNILKEVVRLGGGLEAASLEEVFLARAAGCPPNKIIFDSPAKTRRELAIALDLGVYINADNFDELERIAEQQEKLTTPRPIGLRLNPRLGSGTIPLTGVSSATSQFGVPVDSNEDKIIEAFAKYPWLVGLHVHVGSQGYQLSNLVEGLRRVCHIYRQIEEKCGQDRIQFFDVGGGLPVSYKSGQRSPEFSSYANLLADSLPMLFKPKLQLITEFGRAMVANGGWAVSRVEYVKRTKSSQIATIHLGADFLLRRAYNPNYWYHEITVCGPNGDPKANIDQSAWTIAGPLCFAGDIIGRDLSLPPIEEGDLVVIQDIGAYTLGMWSRHCSRAIPMVVGHELKKDPSDPTSEVSLQVLRKRESLDDVVAFWTGRETWV